MCLLGKMFATIVTTADNGVGDFFKNNVRVMEVLFLKNSQIGLRTINRNFNPLRMDV